ncbi:MAG: hypothetical protein ACOC4C_01665 [Fibrobacterota bacterium]
MSISQLVVGPVLSTRNGKKGFNFLVKIPLSFPVIDAETVLFFTRIGLRLKRVPLGIFAGLRYMHVDEKKKVDGNYWYEGDIFNPNLTVEWNF